jgi:hypothetical protein
MKVSPLVHISKSLKNLKAPITDIWLRERLDSVFHKLVEIALLDEKMDNIQQKHDMVVIKMLLSITDLRTMYSIMKYNISFSLITSLSFTMLGWFMRRKDFNKEDMLFEGKKYARKR